MKALFVCEDSLLVSPLFSAYFNHLCRINSLKIKSDFCGINTQITKITNTQLLPVLQEEMENDEDLLSREFQTKVMTCDLLLQANIIFYSNKETKDAILKEADIPKDLLFPMTRTKKKLQSFDIEKNKKKLSNLIELIQDEVFFFVERTLRHKNII